MISICFEYSKVSLDRCGSWARPKSRKPICEISFSEIREIHEKRKEDSISSWRSLSTTKQWAKSDSNGIISEHPDDLDNFRYQSQTTNYYSYSLYSLYIVCIVYIWYTYFEWLKPEWKWVKIRILGHITQNISVKIGFPSKV